MVITKQSDVMISHNSYIPSCCSSSFNFNDTYRYKINETMQSVPNRAAVPSACLPEVLVDVTLAIVHPFEMNLLSGTPPSENFYKREGKQFQNKKGLQNNYTIKISVDCWQLSCRGLREEHEVVCSE